MIQHQLAQELVHVNLSFSASVDTLRALQAAMLLECQHLLGNSGLHALALVLTWENLV